MRDLKWYDDLFDSIMCNKIIVLFDLLIQCCSISPSSNGASGIEKGCKLSLIGHNLSQM